MEVRQSVNGLRELRVFEGVQERGDKMNHDYAHCIDCTDDCPKDCFRAQLVRDLDKVPISRVSWMSFKGTEECKKEVTE
jgi:hypothetical protein